MANFSRNEVVKYSALGSGWTGDSNSHQLLIDLTGFEKNQIKVEYLEYGRLKVSGKRLENEDKYVQFEKIFKVPENSDLGAIQAKFDGNILSITVPKRKVEEKKPEPASSKSDAEARTEPELKGIKDQDVVPKHEAEARTEPEPEGIKDQDVVPKHEAEARTEPEPEGVKDQHVVLKHEEEAKTGLEPDNIRNAEARTEPEPNDAEARTKLEPDSTKDKGAVPKHEAEEEEELEPVGVKDEGVPKHEEGEEKESKPNGIKDPSAFPKNGAKEKKVSESVGVKTQVVNGNTKENIREKPNDNDKLKKGDNGKKEDEPGYLGSVVETLSKNKGIIAMTAIISFSLGMFTSMKIRGREKKAH